MLNSNYIKSINDLPRDFVLMDMFTNLRNGITLNGVLWGVVIAFSGVTSLGYVVQSEKITALNELLESKTVEIASLNKQLVSKDNANSLEIVALREKSSADLKRTREMYSVLLDEAYSKVTRVSSLLVDKEAAVIAVSTKHKELQSAYEASLSKAIANQQPKVVAPVTTLNQSVAMYNPPVSTPTTTYSHSVTYPTQRVVYTAPPIVTANRCIIGPRGGTYTITASGKKNYGGC